MSIDKFDVSGEFRALHGRYPLCSNRPVIGITANFADGKATLAEAYYRSVLVAGGVPLLIPPYPEREALVETLSHIDALLLTGGADIDPRYMGEEPDYTLLHGINPPRDGQELLLAQLADARSLPILGICRGIQTLAAAFGGSVHQDIYAALATQLLNHDQEPVERGVATHDVTFVAGSKLAAIFGKEQLAVNTFHHQAVSRVPAGFEVVATSPDGVIEGMEAVDGRSIIGVQWHPESFIMNGDGCMMPLFRWLVDEAALYRSVTRLHERMLTIDSHCDTPMLSDTA
ncbi:MAG: gamma-glutamyl-gamma-aminobutyrate hydrolase family protein, partial [Bacteroidaceae bacterium]|nr:gamma-glutamyl-gamma-aminobutyrate hydrolase family protein [Bacteroidaceae bacterium]